jgi:hypothetical protein
MLDLTAHIGPTNRIKTNSSYKRGRVEANLFSFLFFSFWHLLKEVIKTSEYYLVSREKNKVVLGTMELFGAL